MHAVAKVMLALGTITTIVGIVIFAAGSSASFDPTEDHEWKGKTGTFNDDTSQMYSVYSSASSCDSITVSILDGDGDSAIETYECDDSTQSEDGYIYLGLLASTGPYTVDSTETVYISTWGEELEEAAGGFFAVIGSFGVICCGAFMLMFGTIFALTLTPPSSVVILPAGVQQQTMVVQQQTMQQQYPPQQPVQQQYSQQPVVAQAPPVQQQYQDQPPPQGGF